MQSELPPVEQLVPLFSALNVLGQSAATTSSGPLEQGERTPCAVARPANKEEGDVQASGDEHEVEPVPPASKSSEVNEFSYLTFPQKLWKMVESDQFLSIWWGKGGKCVAINEELFKMEVLGSRGPLRVFAMQSMKSFIRQLNIYGFTKMPQDFRRSASLPEFLAEEAAASAHSQILYYYNPSFNREHPHLLRTCKRRVGVKRAASGAPVLGERPPSRSPDTQPVGDTQASPPITTSPKRWAEAPSGLGSTRLPPPAAASALPEAAGPAGSETSTTLQDLLLPPPSSQTPDGLHQAADTSPWFGLYLLAEVAAHLRPGPPHCHTCTCRVHTTGAGNATGPQSTS